MEWSITAGEQRAVVAGVGGGLRAYEVAGEAYLAGYPAGELCPHSAGQVLAPWPNRVRDGRYAFGGTTRQLPLTEPAKHNAIHGLVNWVAWQPVDVAEDAVTVEYELPPTPGYPFALRLRTRWSLGPGGLLAEHEATNLGAGPAPFGLGTHPYLRIPGVPVDELTLELTMRSRLLTDARMLPIGAAKVAGGEYDFTTARRIAGMPLDTAFGLPTRSPEGVISATLTGSGRAVRLWAGAAFGWLQVYIPPGRESIAVEPMTCPPDALRSGRDLVVLEPGETWNGSWGIEPSNTGARLSR